MAAATDDKRLAVRHLPVRRQESKKEKGRKKTNALSFDHPLSAFAENPQLRIKFLLGTCRRNNDSTSTMCILPEEVITVLIKNDENTLCLKGT